MTVVVDTSVVLAFYLPAEPYKAQALALLAAYAAGRVRIATPTLTIYEILNVVARCARGVKAGQTMSLEQAAAVRMAVERLALEEHPILPLAERVLEIAVQHGRSAYDASYLALAEHLGTVMITADHRLFNAVHDAFPDVRLLGANNEDLTS